MEELKQIIDNKCAEFKGLKIYTGWFYDFAEMLFTTRVYSKTNK